jgi:hypothetical protein
MIVATRFRLGLVAANLSLACGGGSGLTEVNGGGDWIPLRVIENPRQPDSTQTPVTIEAASISGDTLHLRLHYAGGCGTHEFGLAASDRLIESDPPQVTVILRHDGHADVCRAGRGANVIANLLPLRRIAGDHISLRVQLYEPWALAPVDQLLVYTF